MSAERKSGNESPQSKRKRPRRWLQFSIRTLLIVISLVAASLAWLTRPEHEERLLSGDAGKVRHEYRQDENDRKVRHGRWELTGRHGDLMVRGRYADDRPQGRWTAYHASGRASLRGVCVGGAPVGPWKAMFPDGRLQADFEFAALPSQASLVGNRPGVVETFRSGPMRVWWPNGQLRLEGQFADDFEEGVWSFYNKDGHKIASGPFRAGRRHGVWTFCDDRGKNAEKVQYVFGRSLPDAPALVKSLTDQLGTGALAQRVTAARKLESLGPLGVPSLVARLKSSDKTTRGLALRSLAQIGKDAAGIWTQIEPCLQDPDFEVRLQARLAGFALDLPHREEHAETLLRMLDRARPGTAIGALVRVFSVAQTRTAAYRGLLQLVVNDNPIVRRQSAAALADLCPEAMPLLAESMKNPDSRIRNAVLDVAFAARVQGDHRPQARGHANRLLEMAAQDRDPDIQERAKAALGRGGSIGQPVFGLGPGGAIQGGMGGMGGGMGGAGGAGGMGGASGDAGGGMSSGGVF